MNPGIMSKSPQVQGTRYLDPYRDLLYPDKATCSIIHRQSSPSQAGGQARPQSGSSTITETGAKFKNVFTADQALFLTAGTAQTKQVRGRCEMHISTPTAHTNLSTLHRGPEACRR